jgi:hypothetical protein
MLSDKGSRISDDFVLGCTFADRDKHRGPL